MSKDTIEEITGYFSMRDSNKLLNTLLKFSILKIYMLYIYCLEITYIHFRCGSLLC